jgi:ankyrin repeat protein
MNQKVLRAFTASMLALLGARSFISNSNVQSPSKLQGQSNGAVSPEGKIDFSRDVQPIFAERCYVCHGPTQQMVGLRLDQKQSAFRVGPAGPMILPGNSSESQLILRVTSSKEGFRMPPSGAPLTQQQVNTLRAWIDQGAEWPESSAASAQALTRETATTLDPRSRAVFEAVRKGDTVSLQAMLSDRSLVNVRDTTAATPLMIAALDGDADSVKLLLESGADPNAQNAAGATALMWAVDDLTKARLLLGAGADVNMKSQKGTTALIVAASLPGSAEVMKELLKKDANVNANNGDADGGTALCHAAIVGDTKSLSILIDKGARLDADANELGFTALQFAAFYGNLESVKLLLDRGANINAKDKFGGTALLVAAFMDQRAVATMLVKRGAGVNTMAGGPPDLPANLGTPLMWAAYTETIKPELVKMFLANGADVKARTPEGETALSRAKQRGATPVVDVLTKAGARDSPWVAPSRVVRKDKDVPEIKVAVEKSLALLQKSGPVFSQKRGDCVSCHHQSLPAMAIALARERGFGFNEEIAKQQLETVSNVWASTREPLLQMMDEVGGMPPSASYSLLGLAAEKHPADSVTDAMVRRIAAMQARDGRWHAASHRPPMEYSDVMATAVTLRALQLYGSERHKQEYQKQVERARAWLVSVQPAFTEERTFQLLGLAWAQANPKDIQKATQLLLAEQRKDGGWAQLSTLESDAYATGQVLYALQQAGGLLAANSAYQCGAKFLRETQLEDGSWFVQSRSFPVQPYFESGFPHGKNQWISAAGTSWAAMALMLTAEPAKATSRLRIHGVPSVPAQ